MQILSLDSVSAINSVVDSASDVASGAGSITSQVGDFLSDNAVPILGGLAAIGVVYIAHDQWEKRKARKLVKQFEESFSKALQG